MILFHGDTSKLKETRWHLCELTSERAIEPTLRRIGKALCGIFRNEPVEIFCPIRRHWGVCELGTVNIIFARSTSFKSLLKLKSVTGCVSLVTSGASGEYGRSCDAISVEDSYVQTLIAASEEEHKKRSAGIRVTSFVRVLDGPNRDFSGVVQSIEGGRAVVVIELKTKKVFLETPIGNLQDLSHVPPARRVFYYGPTIDELVADDLKLIAEDLQCQTEVQPEEPPVDPECPWAGRVKSAGWLRKNTCTRFVKGLVDGGMRAPLEIAKLAVEALKKKEIKAPKNFFILHCIIRDQLYIIYRKKYGPRLRDWRDVKRDFPECRFTPGQVASIDPSLGLPLYTAEPCHDGRSREMRHLRRKHVKKTPKRKAKRSRDRCGEPDCRHRRDAHRFTESYRWARCKHVLCRCSRFKERLTSSPC